MPPQLSNAHLSESHSVFFEKKLGFLARMAVFIASKTIDFSANALA